MRNHGSIGQSTTWHALEQLEPRRLLSLTYVEQPIPGNATHAVVLEDLDGDGDIDFASLGFVSGGMFSLRVRLNDGNGQFGPPSDYAIPTINFSRLHFATGDFNGDGAVDVVIGMISGNGVFIPGVGDGSFGTATTVSELLNAVSLWTTDFSGDGIDDIVVDTGGGVLRLAESNGDGTFREAAVLSLGITNAAIVGVSDFNGDGIDDIAVFGSGSFQVWLGGAGGFAPGPISLVDRQPAVGDFDGDGLADLAWSMADPNSTVHWIVRVAINPGDGRFDTSTVAARSPEFWGFVTPQAIDIA